ncbi:hypothetical protein ACQCVE_16830 [Metabacillus sp. 113a]|uniref:hypothetical protein n=1 Tax=Metabacillus sp. 113a TaxID=3404706 RepID=UPI003CE6B74D
MEKNQQHPNKWFITIIYRVVINSSFFSCYKHTLSTSFKEVKFSKKKKGGTDSEKAIFLIITTVVFIVVAAGCGKSEEEKKNQEKIKEYAAPIAVEFAKEMDGKKFIIDEYEFSSKMGGGLLFVRGHYGGEKPKKRTVQISFNTENYREMTADALKLSKVE